MDVSFHSNFQVEYIYGSFVIYWHEHSHYSIWLCYTCVMKYILLGAAFLFIKLNLY